MFLSGDGVHPVLCPAEDVEATGSGGGRRGAVDQSSAAQELLIAARGPGGGLKPMGCDGGWYCVLETRISHGEISGRQDRVVERTLWLPLGAAGYAELSLEDDPPPTIQASSTTSFASFSSSPSLQAAMPPEWSSVTISFSSGCA